MPWCCPPGELDFLTSKLAYSTELFLGLLCVCVVMHKQQLWAMQSVQDRVIVQGHPWEHLGPIMRMLRAHEASSNACGVVFFFSCRYIARGNWENTKIIKRQVACFQPVYGLLLQAALLN